jgi:hypothetical protein
MIKITPLRFPVGFTTGGKLLINERINAKEVNPEMAEAIVYGYLTIMLEHNPKK